MSKGHLFCDWAEYHRLIERLALQIHDSGWQFDSVIALARGGLRVGDVLSRIFEKPLGVMTTSSYRTTGNVVGQGELKIGSTISSAEDVTTGRILLADDLVDSGETLRQLIPFLQERHAGIIEIRTAVLWKKPISVFEPEYCVERMSESPWIHQPFELYEGCDIEALRTGSPTMAAYQVDAKHA
ncbi:MAG: phosphoribosyltransferase family protein [Lautropia sp.]|nr:phosphoribosyltransferase family protein [Lautropia sp.]